MDDMTRFEARFEERLRAFARTGVQAVDSAVVARAVAVEHPRSAATQPAVRRLGGEIQRTRRRSMFRTTLAAAAIVAVVALGGAFAIGRPSPTPSATPSPSLPGVVAPSSTPSEPPSPTSSAVTGPRGAWIATGSMGVPRSEHTAVRLLDGRVLVVGGGSGDQNDLTAELYDPNSGTWSATGNMVKPHARGFPATLLRDGKVLVGEDVEPGTNPSASGIRGAEVYDPASGTWTVTGKMVTVVREGIPTLLRDGRVLVVHPDNAELYDPDTGTWSATGKMITPGQGNGAAVLLPDGRVLVAGGGTNGQLAISAELYDPATGAWTVTGDMNSEHDEIMATLLRDGTVLVMGRGSSFETSAELYDPATGAWTVTGDMVWLDTSNRSATLLPDGKVLVTGDPGPQLYDPGSGTWTAAASMLRPHSLAPATLLLDGRVLVAGGEEAGAAELYDPSAPAVLPLPTLPPRPTPTPTPVPPQAGPVPPNARPWEVTVVNKSSQPATLFVADQNEQGLLGRLVGSATPNVVPPGATVKVTFLLPAKGTGWAIFVNPGPNEGPAAGPAEMSLPGQIHINPSNQPGWLSP